MARKMMTPLPSLMSALVVAPPVLQKTPYLLPTPRSAFLVMSVLKYLALRPQFLERALVLALGRRRPSPSVIHISSP